MPHFVLVAALFATSLALRRKSKSKHAIREEEAMLAEIPDASVMVSRSATRVWREAECNELANLTVGGHKIGGAVSKLCQVWPKKFGEFPVENTQTLVDLLGGGGEIFKKVKSLSKAKDAKFCWKKLGTRERLGDPSGVESKFCEKKVLGTCYGTCPDGMKPMSLVGGFAPLCSSACMQGSHKTPCGFGCSTGAGTCIKQLSDQFGVVLKNLGKLGGYLTGNAAISKTVDSVLRLIDFAIDVVFDLVKLAKQLWKDLPRERMLLGTMIAMVQFVFDHAKEIGGSLKELNGMFGETMEMIMDLANDDFEVKSINLEFISDTIFKKGASILGAANQFADAFVFPRCNATEKTNSDYDCDRDGYNDCGDWSYAKARCKDNEGQCKYKFKFGDMRLKSSCRCK